MIPVGLAYRPAGPIDFRSSLSTLILGLFTALFAALVVWGWEISPIPTLVLLTPALQGFLIGLVIAFVIGRLKLRNVKLLALMGFLCGLASVGLVHVGHQIQLVHGIADGFKANIQSSDTLTAEQKQTAIDLIAKEPYKVADAFFFDRTGHGGLIGSMLYRAEIGVKIKTSQLTGWGMGILWGAEALIVAATASAMAKSRAAKPFCEDCHEWCLETAGAGVLPGTAAEPLADALKIDSPIALSHLRKNLPEPNGTNFSGTTLHTCPVCDQAFADVWLRIDKAKGNKTESTIKQLVTQIRVSPEILVLLRNDPLDLDLEGEDKTEPAEPLAG